MGNAGQEYRSCPGIVFFESMHFLGGILFPQHSVIDTNIGAHLGVLQHPELSVYTDLENP